MLMWQHVPLKLSLCSVSSYSHHLTWYVQMGAGFMLIVWLKLYQQSHPASFEKALSDASCGSAMDRIDHRKSLHQAMMVCYS
jgi:hypothetical protein